MGLRPSPIVLAVAALLAVGAGVGIGAAVWSGGSSSPPVLLVPVKQGGAPAMGAEAGAGLKTQNHAVRANLHFSGLDPGTKVKLSQGIWSKCTRDETYGTFDVNNDTPLGISMWVKIDLDEGSCALSSPINFWKVELPGGGGELGMNHMIFNFDWTTYPDCHNTGGYVWTGGWKCTVQTGGTTGTPDFYISRD